VGSHAGPAPYGQIPPQTRSCVCAQACPASGQADCQSTELSILIARHRLRREKVLGQPLASRLLASSSSLPAPVLLARVHACKPVRAAPMPPLAPPLAACTARFTLNACACAYVGLRVRWSKGPCCRATSECSQRRGDDRIAPRRTHELCRRSPTPVLPPSILPLAFCAV
jgi:hypothetical protein